MQLPLPPNRVRYGPFLALLSLVTFLLVPAATSAHVFPYDISKLSTLDVWYIYLKLGFTHILQWGGLDHILFVLCLFLLNSSRRALLAQITAFTVAHSITLGLGLNGVIAPAEDIVEPLIALSIVFVAVENLFAKELQPWRLIIVFVFGLVHGLGFASALTESIIPQTSFITALIMFNIGVELGQITIIILAWFLIGKWFSHKPWYRSRIVYPTSALIATIALFWFFQRLLGF